MGRRVLLSAFGSAGDLFPLLPIVVRLQEQGHEVRGAVPRALGLYLRASGLQMYALGDGSEMRVFEDQDTVTTRFGGWASWRRTATEYVAPRLAGDVALLHRIVDEWQPHVVVTTSFAAAARVVAATRAVPRLDLTIYPQHQCCLLPNRTFARPFRRGLAEALGLGERDMTVTRLAWGATPETVLLHDPALIKMGGNIPGEMVGFPYWDAGPARLDDFEKAEAWLAGGDGPTLLVTLGSFLGARQRATWMAAAKASAALGVRTVFVGPRTRWHDELVGSRPDVLTVGFVPLSRLVPQVDAVVHHGGIGTTFAALRAGRPAAVVPQAFDQPHNAQMVAQAGVGIDASDGALVPAVERLLTDQALTRRAAEVAAALVPSELATTRVVERILQVAT